MTKRDLSGEDLHVSGDFFATLRNCGGFYESPCDEGGEFIGPVVGYAGQYEDDNAEGQLKQWVGFVYYNVAQVEIYPYLRMNYAGELAEKIHAELDSANVTKMVAAPMGGIQFGVELGTWLSVPTVYLEKKITALATSTSRERSSLVFGRHALCAGDRVLIVEDTVNNISTPREVMCHIEEAGAELAGLVCVINRSPLNSFKIGDREYPIISVKHRPTPQYRQDDSAVAEFIRAGNVCWKPKKVEEWATLMAAMEKGAK
jgi:adenine/guanine phosphoribosyltransferase-like PRPP-binding protein